MTMESKLSLREREIVNSLNHPVLTEDFLEKYLNTKVHMMLDPDEALNKWVAYGFYEAVKLMAT